MLKSLPLKISASFISFIILYIALSIILNTISHLKKKEADQVNVAVVRQPIKQKIKPPEEMIAKAKAPIKKIAKVIKTTPTIPKKQDSAPVSTKTAQNDIEKQMISRGAELASAAKAPALVVHYQSTELSAYLNYLADMGCIFILSSPAGTPAGTYAPRSPGKIGPMPDDLSGYSRQLRALGGYDEHPELNRIIDLFVSTTSDLSLGYGCKLSALWSKEFEYMLSGTIEAAAEQKGFLYTEIESALAFFNSNKLQLDKLVTSTGEEIQVQTII